MPAAPPSGRRARSIRIAVWTAGAALLPCALPIAAGLGRSEDATRDVALGRRLGVETQRFVAALDDAQRAKALHAFDDEERFDLRLAPIGLEGLTVREMSDAQWGSLRNALAGVLSPRGMRKVETIRSLEREIAAMEGGLTGWMMGDRRDPQLYYLSLFGDPGPDATWGLRFDGHHLSLNWTVVPGRPLSVTPLFLGAQPRVVPEGLERAGLRVLAREEELGLALGRSLDEAQRAVAEVPLESGWLMGRPMFVGGGSRLELPAPAGLARCAMTPAQRAELDELIEVYLANFAPAIAEQHRARIALDADAIHFVVAGSLVPGEPSYYRIQGSELLIEFDNTDEAADHVHLVWRDAQGDFGRDLLREHHRRHH